MGALADDRSGSYSTVEVLHSNDDPDSKLAETPCCSLIGEVFWSDVQLAQYLKESSHWSLELVLFGAESFLQAIQKVIYESTSSL
ncbi:hypothetical protein CEXT_296621 [Caerostris extrusa]|uniref:Uncharacterized protein n=1 Tax=Caerostris extrusa TaxID=172846 RepID=A0AAV4UP83_CAEEX|nr:hypothetical protein CEXT_296621 [Caerostris extrusa]